jgi:hypothetical protein
MHAIRTLLAMILVAHLATHGGGRTVEAAEPKPAQTPEEAKRLIEAIEAKKRQKLEGKKAGAEVNPNDPSSILGVYWKASRRQRDLELKYLRDAILRKTKRIGQLHQSSKGTSSAETYERLRRKKLQSRLAELALAQKLPSPILAYPIKLGHVGHIFSHMSVMGIADKTHVLLIAVIPEDAGAGPKASSATTKMKKQQFYLRRDHVVGFRIGAHVRLEKPLRVVEMRPDGATVNSKLVPVLEELNLAALDKSKDAAVKARTVSGRDLAGKAAFADVARKQKAEVIVDLKRQLKELQESLAASPNARSKKIQAGAMAERIKRLESGQTDFEPILLDPLKIGTYGTFTQPVRVMSMDAKGIVALARIGATPFEKKNLKPTYVRIEGIKTGSGIRTQGLYQPYGVFRVVGEVANKKYSTYRAGYVMTVRLHWASSVDASKNPMSGKVAVAPVISEAQKPYMAESDRQRKLFIKALQADGRNLYKTMVKKRTDKRFQTSKEWQADYEDSKATLKAINGRISQLMNSPKKPFVPFLMATESMVGSMGKLPAWVAVVAVDGADGLVVDATLPLGLSETLGLAKIDPERQPTVKMLLRPIKVSRFQVGERQLVGGVWHITAEQQLKDGSKMMVAKQVDIKSIYGTNEP